jgi:hypothetical protein
MIIDDLVVKYVEVCSCELNNNGDPDDWSTQVEPGAGVTVSGADDVLAKL